MSAATIIPERLRSNPGNFFFLDINIDSDFEGESFIDLVFSFRHNYTLRYITLVRSNPAESTDGKVFTQRSTQEIRLLIKEILMLPSIKTLDFEGFNEEEMLKFTDLLQSGRKRVIQ